MLETTKMKQYLGIIASIIYALVIRLLAECNVIEINSIAYLIIAPAVLGFIPFFFRNDKFYSNIWKAIFFPLISVLFFLFIAILTRIEDIICLIIIGWPYILISVILSVGLHSALKKKDNGISKNMMSIVFLPILLGAIEKELPKHSTQHLISNKIIINTNAEMVYNNLLEVPDMTESINIGLSNYFGVPRPIYSTYDKDLNIRKGYFENGIVLYESVEYSKINSELVFKIDVDKSELKNSPTLQHVLTTGGINFKNIKYKLIKLDENRTELKLSTEFEINSNLNFYGKYWSELIINDFERNILNSLKKNLEMDVSNMH